MHTLLRVLPVSQKVLKRIGDHLFDGLLRSIRGRQTGTIKLIDEALWAETSSANEMD